MSYIQKYWTDKEYRSIIAKEHTERMQTEYSSWIQKSVDETIIYDIDFKCVKDVLIKRTTITIEDLDTVKAGSLYCNCGKVALLNFASYKNPGGMFLKGSRAQEECLCHASYLYNILSQFVKDFYDWNNNNKNKSLYMNRALYTPGVLFTYEDKKFICDVITCAAPNKRAAQKYLNVSDEENIQALKSRIKFVLDIAIENNVDVLILGAYGCGVFGQNPIDVAAIFKKYLKTTHKNIFRKVVFAIPKDKNRNLNAFNAVFNK